MEANNISRVTEIQQLALQKGLLTGQSLIVNSENGSGKTLAFLLPILNQLYNLRHADRGPSHFTMSRQNEQEMFQNAAEIFHHAKKHKTAKVGPFKGAVVLSYSKELVNQIYVQARLLDPLGLFNFNRMTSSL